MFGLSQGRIRIRDGAVAAEGRFRPASGRIADFVRELGLRDGVIRLRFGRVVFSRGIDPTLHQRLRNFLINDCLRRRPQG